MRLPIYSPAAVTALTTNSQGSIREPGWSPHDGRGVCLLSVCVCVAWGLWVCVCLCVWESGKARPCGSQMPAQDKVFTDKMTKIGAMSELFVKLNEVNFGNLCLFV